LFKVANEVKVGALATIAIVLLVLGYNLMRGKNLLKREKLLYASYENVGGLSVASFVKYNGMNVGRVQELQLDNRNGGRIVVSMNVSPDLKIPRGSVARIVQHDLLGGKAVQIELSSNTEFVQSGDTLASALEADLIGELKMRAASLLGSLDTVVNSVKTTFDEKSQDNLRKSFSSIQSSLQAFDESLESNRGRLDKILANVESITTSLNNNKEQITAILSNLEAISDTLRRAEFEQTIAEARDALGQVSAVMEKINKGEGSLGLMVNDPKLYNNLESASKSLDSLLVDVKAHPKRYVHVSVFGKKDK
jgi:phospholipid/cholesterol/gamma-HCH transport system substrate-binding protein